MSSYRETEIKLVRIVPQVTTHDGARHGFEDGDYVEFREVQGMVGLNNLSKPVKISDCKQYSFKLTDVPADVLAQAYTREGLVSQVKVPEPFKFKSWSDARTSPVAPDEFCLPVPDLGKFGRPEQLHLAFEGLRECGAGAGAGVVDAAVARNGVQETKQEEVDKEVIGKVAK